MIISASRRTDIPAFFSEWFFNRLDEGFVVTQNPFNAKQLSKIKLDSEVVDAIVFWTKNPEPMLPYLPCLDEMDIPYYFQYTITPYGQDAEPRLPKDKTRLISTFKALSDHVGPNRVIWRYDPIFFSEKYTHGFHVCAFERCASLLAGCTKRVVISFLDMDYNNTKAIDKIGIRDGSDGEKSALAKELSRIASAYGLEIETCAEEIDLDECGIKHGHCVDAKLIEEISGRTLSAGGCKKDKTQRLLCGCIASIDIGSYNTCLHGCTYCYANYSPGAIANNCKKHNPNSALLIGECDVSEVPLRKGQVSFFEKTPSEKQLKLDI